VSPYNDKYASILGVTMSLIPAFTVGIWNAWIIQILLFLIMSIPDLFMSKETKERTKRATESMPLSKTYKRLGLSTHVVIMPLVFIYSIFVPIKLGTAWFYISLPVLAIAIVMTIMTTINFAATPIGEPVTKGIYRISRHPIYFSAFLFYLGTAIATASWVILVLALAWIIIWSIIVAAEERFLIEKYSDFYQEYMKRTPRWIGLPKTEA
jgi:protein-S-isoprenylcysteine O-methyltransferase Ste14